VLPTLAAGVEAAGPISGTTDDGHSDTTLNGALVVLAVRFAGSDGYMHKVQAVVQSLCNTERALVNAGSVAHALAAVISGAPLSQALPATFPEGAAAQGAVQLAGSALAAAAAGTASSGDFKGIAKKFGPACDVQQALPLSGFSAKYTAAGGEACPDFKSAVRTNIALSGDTCGRAPLMGALTAAAEAPGAALQWAPWLALLTAGEEVTRLAAALASAAEESAQGSC